MREIKIFAQDDMTFASLVNGGEVLDFATASYNQNDAEQGLPYSFEIGAKLALDRLLEKMKEAEKTEKYESFDWETFSKGELAVHCETEIEAKRFLRACKKRGCLWLSGDDLSKYNFFHRYKEKTCYCCADYGRYPGKGIAYGNLNHYKSRNIEIVKYTPEVREVERQAKVGEWIRFTWYGWSLDIGLEGKIGKVLEVDNFSTRVEHETVWGTIRESRKGFEKTSFTNSSIKYVVLEGYQGK